MTEATSARNARMRELLEAGSNRHEIAAELGLSVEQVRNYMRYHGLRDIPKRASVTKAAKAHAEAEERRQKDAMLRELLKARAMEEAVIEAVRSLVPRLPRAEIPVLTPPSSAHGREMTGFLMLSDLHIGAVADREETGGFGHYNYDVFRRRLDGLCDTVRSITARERQNAPIKRLVAPLLGDLIENDDIFPAQGSMIDLDLAGQFISCIVDLSRFYVSMLDVYDVIFVPCVTGNHGRIGRKGQRKRHINWDYLASKMLEIALSQYSDRITFEVPKAPFAVIDIEGFKFLLRHGDGIKSWGGIPYYGIQRSTGRWIAIQAAVGQRFDYMCMGHFHNPATLPYTGGEVIINGCFPGVTEFSVEVMESLNEPMQMFGFVHPQYGLAARYPIYLDRGKR